MSDTPQTGSAGTNPPNFQVRIPLEWAGSADVPMVYANQVMISHAGPEFFLVFGVVLPPDNPEEIPDSFAIQPQVRVVIARDAMPAIVQAMADNLNRYRANIARQQQGQQPGTQPGQQGASPPKRADDKESPAET